MSDTTAKSEPAPVVAGSATTRFPGDNATFYYFKDTGKYYTSSRGVMPESVWTPYYVGQFEARPLIIAANEGAMPGLSGKAMDFRVFIVLDENVPYGWPITLKPDHLAA